MGNDNSLPGFGAEPNSVTISGFSGGSKMAGMMTVIYSETFKGSGLLAGGPYKTRPSEVKTGS